MHNTVFQIVIPHNRQLRSLFHQLAQRRAVSTNAKILRRSDIDSRFTNHLGRIGCDRIGREIAVTQRVKIRQIIPHAALVQHLVGTIGDLRAARDCTDLVQLRVIVRNAGRLRADISGDIALSLSGFVLVCLRRLRASASQHTNEQNNRHQNQHRQEDQPGILPQKAHPLFFAPAHTGRIHLRLF